MNIEQAQLTPPVLRAVRELGFKDFTEIQEKCIPSIKEGKDIVGQSATGSGKTAAFGLPLLEKVTPGRGIQCIILTPTRELCVQVSDAIQSFAKYMPVKITSIYGGVGIEPQIDKLKRTDVVVGTPGRVLDHVTRRTMELSHVKIVVLDEADKMLEMGFIEDVQEILTHVPRERQTLLFSATVPPTIHGLIKGNLKTPVWVKTKTYVDKTLLRQVFYDVPQNDKFSLLLYLLKHKTAGLALVFCATRREVDVIARNLRMQDVSSLPIHGGLSMSKRTIALDALKKEKIDVLVATDVAARGLDIRNVSHVYNYDVPKTSEEYVHRIGRTARMGEEGDAVTILSQRDYQNFEAVMSDRSLEIKKAPLPQFPRAQFVRQDSRRGPRRGMSDSRSDGRSDGRGRFETRGRPMHGSRPVHRDSRPSSGRREGPSEGRSDRRDESRGRSESRRPRFGNVQAYGH
jgi:ATP-dependent RNA helicase DeaD